MSTFRRILVGVEFVIPENGSKLKLTRLSKQVFEQAWWLAWTAEADLEIITVLPSFAEAVNNWEGSPVRSELQEIDIRYSSQVQEKLDDLIPSDVEQQFSVSTRICSGVPWAELLKAALEDPETLLMIGNKNIKGLRRTLLGSTAKKLVRKAPCPVWVIKPRGASELDRVLVATDFSPCAQKATDLAADLSSVTLAELHLVHSITPSVAWHYFNKSEDVEQKTTEYRIRMKQGKEQLDSEVRRLEASHVSQTPCTHLQWGDDVESILQSVAETDPDLLVIGSEGRSGVKGVLVGNTAEEVLDGTDCSVLVVKPDEFVCPIPTNSLPTSAQIGTC